MNRVVSTGSIIVDLAVEVPAVPVPGGDVVATPIRAFVGGGFNLVAAAARHGAHVVYAGMVGNGPYGRLASAALASEGISRVPGTALGDTGVCITLVDANAERTFITSPGAESHVSVDHFFAVHPQSSDVYCVSGYDAVYEGSRDALGEFVAGLPRGVRVVFDPGPLLADIPRDIWNLILARTTVLTVNEQEARFLTNDAQAEDQLDVLHKQVSLPADAATVIRRGADGCEWRMGARSGVVATIAVNAIDSTGAGDTHTGTIAAALAEGFSLEQALRRANVAAAISVTRPGPATAPKRGELDRLLLTHP